MSYVRGEIGHAEAFYLVASMSPSNAKDLFDVSTSSRNLWFGLVYESTLNTNGLVYFTPSYTNFLNPANTALCRLKFNSDSTTMEFKVGDSWYMANDLNNGGTSSFGSFFNFDKTGTDAAKKLVLIADAKYNVDEIYGGIPYEISGLFNDLQWKFATPSGNLDNKLFGGRNKNLIGSMMTEVSPIALKSVSGTKFEVFLLPEAQHSYLVGDKQDTLVSLNITPQQYFGEWLSGTSNRAAIISNSVAKENSIVVFSQAIDAHQGYVYSYCDQNSVCGKCMGKCPDGSGCIVDSHTLLKINDKTDNPLTCSVEPTKTTNPSTNSMERTQNGGGSHHITPIIIVVIVAIAIIAIVLILRHEHKKKK